MAIAYHSARLAPDPSTQNGAYLLAEVDGVFRGAIGRNMPVRGMAVDWASPDKSHALHHAEEAAILAASSFGIPTFGATLFCPWIACTRCARVIVGARVGRVVGHRDLMRASAKLNPKWNAEIAGGLEILANANVDITWLHGSINGSAVRHAGYKWDPATLELTEWGAE